MAAISFTVDDSGVRASFEQLKKKIMTPDGMGQVMKITAASIWIPKIKARLGVRTGTSEYEQELASTMRKLDEEFVLRLSGQSLNGLSGAEWADVLESDRRAPGGYNKGDITNRLENAIKPSEPYKTTDGIAIGIGDISVLNSLFPDLGVEQQYKLWQILNYGTGTIGAGGSPVIRSGKQIFYNRKIDKGVLAYTTVNPGFKGREFFVKMDGSMHEGDYVVKRTIIRYINSVIRDLSYRK